MPIDCWPHVHLPSDGQRSSSQLRDDLCSKPLIRGDDMGSAHRFPSRSWLCRQNYRYKSVATKFLTILGWKQYYTLVEISLLEGIEPAPHPVVRVQTSTP